jgi:nitrogen fixation NifU-like protein
MGFPLVSLVAAPKIVGEGVRIYVGGCMQNQQETTDLDRMVAELQSEIVEQERALYSDKVIEEAHSPRNLGRMPEPDTRGLVQSWCGDTMEIYLRLNGERIEKAIFMTNGCGATLACGSMLTQMVTGVTLEEASEIRPGDLLSALDGLPKENVHCAELAVSTLQNAIFNWRAARDFLGRQVDT